LAGNSIQGLNCQWLQAPTFDHGLVKKYQKAPNHSPDHIIKSCLGQPISLNSRIQKKNHSENSFCLIFYLYILSLYIKMGVQMFVCLFVGMWRANGNPNPCTDLDEIFHANPLLSKEGFGPGLTPAPLTPWA